jgi:tetratricopeptide (TPR) repeat protein
VVLLVAAPRPRDALPLLEYALTVLEERRRGDTLTFEAYDALGGIAGAIGERAESVWRELPEAARAAFPELLRALVEVGGEEEVTIARRRAPLAEATRTPGARTLVERLVAARLLVAEGDGEEALVTVAHEALLGRWPRAADRLQAERELLRVHGRVRHAAHRWAGEGRDPTLLLAPGRPLEEARLLVATGFSLEDDERAFVAASEARALRGRRLARAGVTAIAVLGLVAAVLAWFANEQRSRAADRAAEAERARDRAEHLLDASKDLTLWAVTDLYEALSDLPGSLGLTQALVERVKVTLQRLQLREGDDPGLLLVAAAAYARLAEVEGDPAGSNLGRLEASRGYLEQAGRIYAGLLERAPADPRYVKGMSRVQGGLAYVDLVAGHVEAARERAQGALDALERLAVRFPRDTSTLVNRMRMLEILAAISGARGDSDEPLKRLHAARDLAAAWLEDGGGDEARASLAAQEGSIADQLVAAARYEEARPYLERSLEAAEALLARQPSRIGALRRVSVACVRLGDLERKEGHAPAAEAAYRRALALDERLAAFDDHDARAQSDLAVSLDRVAQSLLARGEAAEGLALQERRIAIDRGLYEANPGDRGLRGDYHLALLALANALAATERFEDALARQEEAYRLAADAVAAEPGDVAARLSLAQSCEGTASALFNLGQREADAERRLERLRASKARFEEGLDLYTRLEREGLLPPWARNAPELMAARVRLVEETLRLPPPLRDGR